MTDHTAKLYLATQFPGQFGEFMTKADGEFAVVITAVAG
jgi:hypothetical protein